VDADWPISTSPIPDFSDVILYVMRPATFGPADQQVLDLLPKEVPASWSSTSPTGQGQGRAACVRPADRAKRDFAHRAVSAKLHSSWKAASEISASCGDSPSSARRHHRPQRKFLASESCAKSCSASSARNCLHQHRADRKFEQEGDFARVSPPSWSSATRTSHDHRYKGAPERDLDQARLDMANFRRPVYWNW